MSESYAGKINRKLLKKRRIIDAAAGREPADLVLKNTVYVNVRYTPRAKRLVLLHRIPSRGNNLAIFHICATNAREGKWWEGYPPGTFWNIDLGDADNIECIAAFLHSSRSEAVANLRLGMDNYDRSTTKSK